MAELYKTHRPTDWEGVISQTDSVNTLKSYLENDNVPHSLIFAGPSGCGKTTCARILADKMECHEADFMEINGAESRGIDTIRDIQKSMKYAPMGGKVKIYMLDEYHKATSDNMNAILKLIEECPDYVYFIFATTEPQKIIRTIITRSVRINFNEIPDRAMIKFLNKFSMEHVPGRLAEPIKREIIKKAEGSMRMALVLIEGLLPLETEKERLDYLNNSAGPSSLAIDLCRKLINYSTWKEVASVLNAFNGDPESARRAILGYCQSIMLRCNAKSPRAYLVADSFRESVMYTGKPGLVMAAWEVFHGNDE